MLTDVPDKTEQFAGDSDTDFVVLQTTCAEASIAMAQSLLGVLGNSSDLGWLMFLADLQGATNAGGEAVVPGRLDQHTPSVAAAGFGDCAEATFGATGVFAGYQSHIAHQLPGPGEATEIAELGDQRCRGNEVEPTQGHQGVYHRAHPPLLHQLRQRLVEPFDTCMAFGDGLSVLDKSDVLSGMVEGERGKIALVSSSPGSLATVTSPMTQEHRLELLASLQACSNSVTSSPTGS